MCYDRNIEGNFAAAYLQMSYEAQAFYDFITNPDRSQAKYREIQKPALEVSHVTQQARESAEIYFTPHP